VPAVQPAGCSTVVAAWEQGSDTIQPVSSTTCISGLSVPFDIDASLALQHLRQSNGLGLTVSDGEIYECQRLLFEKEGIFAEPAGATALAGLCQALRDGQVDPSEPMVCLVTGSGFKDPESVAAAAGKRSELLLAPEDLPDYLPGKVRT